MPAYDAERQAGPARPPGAPAIGEFRSGSGRQQPDNADENGSQSGETTFNYTEDLDGRAITDWFERISETERHLMELERVVKYDKLGVNDAILQLEITMDRKRLVAPEQFLPMLDRVVKNESFMHQARERAAYLADQIRNAK